MHDVSKQYQICCEYNRTIWIGFWLVKMTAKCTCNKLFLFVQGIWFVFCITKREFAIVWSIYVRCHKTFTLNAFFAFMFCFQCDSFNLNRIAITWVYSVCVYYMESAKTYDKIEIMFNKGNNKVKTINLKKKMQKNIRMYTFFQHANKQQQSYKEKKRRKKE